MLICKTWRQWHFVVTRVYGLNIYIFMNKFFAMKFKKLKTLLTLVLSVCITSITAQYYPDAEWEVKKPEELKMSKRWLDSAINFALLNENKVDRDLRLPY